MHTLALSVLPGLVAVVLLAGCGYGDRVLVVRDAAPTAAPMFVDQSLPAWHPALPEGHPPVPEWGSPCRKATPPCCPKVTRRFPARDARQAA